MITYLPNISKSLPHLHTVTIFPTQPDAPSHFLPSSLFHPWFLIDMLHGFHIPSPEHEVKSGEQEDDCVPEIPFRLDLLEGVQDEARDPWCQELWNDERQCPERHVLREAVLVRENIRHESPILDRTEENRKDG